MNKKIFVAIGGVVFAVLIVFLFIINNNINDNLSQIRILTVQMEKLKLEVNRIDRGEKKIPAHSITRDTSKEIASDSLREKLEKIRLPVNATREETAKYIDAVLAASKTQNTFTRNDMQIGMLEKIDHKYLPILISRMTDDNGPINFHSSLAVANMAEEGDKKLIIRILPVCPKLIDVVVKFGWQKDVRDLVFKKIKTENYLPANWIVCAGQLAKPEDYEVLTGYFIRTADKSNTYDNIKNLPGIRLENAVSTIWKANKYGPPYWMKKQIALIAAEFGHLDALAMVIELRNDRNYYLSRKAYKEIYKLTGRKDSYQNLKKWFNANKDNLIFDEKTKRYAIRKQREPVR